MRMRLLLGMLLLAALFSGCDGMMCVDVVDNFTLRQLTFDAAGSTLTVAGDSSASYCTGSGEAPYRGVVATINTTTGAITASVTPSSDRNFPLPESTGEMLFRGAFSSRMCRTCELTMHTSTGLELRIPAEQTEGLVLSVARGSDVVGVYQFGVGHAERLSGP